MSSDILMGGVSAIEPEWVLHAAVVENLLKELGYCPAITDFIASASREVSQSKDTSQFLEACYRWSSNPQQYSGEVLPSSWKALMVVSQFPATLQKHRTRCVPQAISAATLCDMQRHMTYADGRWHFDNLGWLCKHVTGEFFEIGRLQYQLGKFGYLVRVYRDGETGEVVPLSLTGRQCTLDGWPMDGAHGFVTAFEERSDGIYGHPISPANGAISPQIKRLHLHSEVLLGSESSICHIHIPHGRKLDSEVCCASMREAKAFFAKHFPEINLRGYATATWLLDRELTRVLPPHSNIAAFGNLFRPLPLNNGDDRQLLERAFGSDVTWDMCRAETSLQKAVLEHHRNGGQFRMTAGFILMEDIEALTARS